MFFTVNKGQFSITLNQVMDLAPYAQMVVYAVMPGGEMLADSQDIPVQLCLHNKVGNLKKKMCFRGKPNINSHLIQLSMGLLCRCP